MRSSETSTQVRTVASAAPEGLSKRLKQFFDWRPAFFRVSRADCHRLKIPTKGIPKRLQASTIRLQVMNLSGLQDFGFAWRAQDTEAEVWYWDELKLKEKADFPRAEAMVSGILPCPEMLFRKQIPDGISLLVCKNGYEAVSMENGKTRRTRWFEQIPDAPSWIAFIRDSGKIPAEHPGPDATVIKLSEKMTAGWQIQSSLIKAQPLAAWITTSVIVLAGMLVAGLLAYDLKLANQIATERSTLEQLTLEKKAILQLQKRINARTVLFDSISNGQPKVLQLRLMQALASTGLFSEDTGISLLEWEYRNERLRLMFSVPKNDFSLGLFLSTLENTGFLREIRLMPDTPLQTVGIQAVVTELPINLPSITEESEALSEAAPPAAKDKN